MKKLCISIICSALCLLLPVQLAAQQPGTQQDKQAGLSSFQQLLVISATSLLLPTDRVIRLAQSVYAQYKQLTATKTTPEYVPALTHMSAKEAQDFLQLLNPKMQDFNSWKDMEPAVQASLRYVKVKNQATVAITHGKVRITWGQLTESLELLLTLLPQLDAHPELLVSEFMWYKVGPESIFTGYYQPVLEVSATPTKEYRFPLYARPPDLKTLKLGDFDPSLQGKVIYYRVDKDEAKPYHTRESIDGNKILADKGLELAYAKDMYDLAMLQVQGSGLLEYPDGKQVHALYAVKSGLPYVSVAKTLIAEGLLPQTGISMQKLREWFKANPEKEASYLYKNPSYVFFRLADKGPYGAINQIITPWASLAVDPKHIPYGGIVLFQTPLAESDRGNFIAGIGFAQDTGSAIRKNRIDLFCGAGPVAWQTAGHLYAKGTTILLIKP